MSKPGNIPDRKEPFAGLGMAITILRMWAGMTQKEFARKLNMDPAFLSRLEREKQRPSVETLTRLLKVLDIGVRELDDAMRMARQEEVPREVTIPQLVEGTTSVNQQLHELALEVAKVMERRRNKQTP